MASESTVAHPLLIRWGQMTRLIAANEVGVIRASTIVRQRFGAMLRLEVGDTVLEPEELEGEMRELIRAVST